MLMSGRRFPTVARDPVWELFCTILLTILAAESVQLEGGLEARHSTSGKNLVPPTRIERATRGLGNRCSIQLSYGGLRGILRTSALPVQQQVRRLSIRTFSGKVLL